MAAGLTSWSDPAGCEAPVAAASGRIAEQKEDRQRNQGKESVLNTAMNAIGAKPGGRYCVAEIPGG